MATLDEVYVCAQALPRRRRPAGLCLRLRLACAFVCDRLFEDIDGARAARIRTIWVSHSTIPEEEYGAHAAQPDATVQSLVQVLDVVDEWSGAA
ncbi:HAD hydrolase-like protein [Streptomyces sp. NPDC050164]|uniref:HAD hydrolase-like protein n=1 Tax=Streptomyces sp. NPDC050164 TaxID=3365605 RepID=UPI00379521DA